MPNKSAFTFGNNEKVIALEFLSLVFINLLPRAYLLTVEINKHIPLGTMSVWFDKEQNGKEGEAVAQVSYLKLNCSTVM